MTKGAITEGIENLELLKAGPGEASNKESRV
jgi:hypothetical protein